MFFIIFQGANFKSSHYFLCCITLERVLSVYFPHRIKTMCTVRLAKVLVILIPCILIVLEPVIYYIFVQLDFVFGLIYYEEKFPKGFLSMNIVLLMMETIIPMSIILTGTILICIKLYTGNSLIKNNTSTSRRKAEISNSITRTLLVTDLAFFVMQAPLFITTLMFSIIEEVNLSSPETVITCLFITAFWAQLNSAVNFYLYVLSGARFRQEVN